MFPRLLGRLWTNRPLAPLAALEAGLILGAVPQAAVRKHWRTSRIKAFPLAPMEMERLKELFLSALLQSLLP